MKHLASILRLSALVLLCGCGGGGGTSGSLPQSLNIAGNWQFSTTSTIPGMPPATIAGSFTQSGNSVNGAVHLGGSNCFDQLTTIGLTGTLTGSNVSLTSASVAGQVLTLTGGVTNNGLTGTYAINGGCANGDQGNLTGFKVPAIGGTLRVEFESRSEERWGGLGMLTQGSASSEGSFGIDGTVDVNLRCFSGTITSGTFPSPSFILGTSAAFNVKTDDGTLVFVGTVNEDGTRIIGHHNVIGGACDGEFGRGCFGSTRQGSCLVP